MDAAATAAAARACVLFVQCNPLLDCSVDVDEAFLQRHGVQLGSSYVYTSSDDKCPHKALFDELLTRQRGGSGGGVVYSAGGAGLNTSRVAQWVLRANAAAATTQDGDAAVATAPHEGGAVVFAGCVGDDAAAAQLRRAAAQDGVVAVWQVAPAGQHTGRCVVLHCGGARALVAEVGAAACLRVDCLDSAPVRDALAAARVVYTTLYSATPSHAQHAMKLAASTRSSNSSSTIAAACPATTTSTTSTTTTTTQPLRTAFAIALSAREVLGAFAEDFVDFLEKLDVVFCNRGELRDLAMLLQLVPDEMSERECVAAVAQSMPYDKHLPQRYVVVTRGAQPVLCATNNGDVVEVPVVALSQQQQQQQQRQQQPPLTATASAAAVTTPSHTRRATGAGDAFVGGFLAAWIAGCAVVQCCRVGAQCAAFVMQHGIHDLQLAAAPRLRAPTL